MAELRIGISGWTYPPWRGVFYPKGLPQKRELEFASRQLNSIEINGTFYSLQKPKSHQAWYDATPAGFVFAVKGPQFITHIRRLKDVETPLANLMASGLLLLAEKLGPILWQFPPNLKFDEERFAQFFKLLPHDVKEAAKLAKKHDDRVESITLAADGVNRRLRHAIEVRHESFKSEQFVDLCRRHGAAIVIADAANEWPVIEDVTADFVYLRLHGHEQVYASGYTDKALANWAKRIKVWSQGKEPADADRIGPAAKKVKSRDVYVYFDNDLKVKSPLDAQHLTALLAGRKKPKG